MKNISENIKNALKQEAVTTTARITVLPDNTVIDGNNLSSVKIVDKCYNEGVIIGTSMCKEVEIEIINNNYQLENKEFILEVGVLLENGTYEYISYGNFIVKEYNDLKSNNRYKIIAYDYMDKLNVVFEDNYDYSTPITLQKFYENFADFYGIEFVEQTLPNQNFSIIEKPYFENMTGRVVLSRIAEMFGSFAKFNSENKLEMYLTNTTNEQITRNEMNSSLEINNMFGPINVVALRLSDVEGENVTLRDEDSILTYGEKTLQISDNPFTYTQALREAAIQGIYDRVKGFSYYPTKFNSKLIYFDCGDIVNVQDMKTDNFYPTVILNQTLQVPNTIKCKFENSALTDNALKYQFVSEQAAKNRRTEYIVDKQNQKITQVVEEVSSITKTTVEAEGKNIYINDSAEEPLVDISLHGETRQKTRSGKNRFDRNKVYQSSMATINDTGINIKNCWATTIMANENVLKDFKPNTTYTCSAKVKCVSKPSTLDTASNHNNILIFYNQSGSPTTKVILHSLNKNDWVVGNTYDCRTVFVTPTDLTDYKILSYNYRGNNDGSATYTANGEFEITELMIIEGNIADEEFELYGSSPSPDYPSEIENVEGKNLIPFTSQKFTLNGIEYYVQNRTLYLNGTSSGETSSIDGAFKDNFSFKLKAGTYTLSHKTGIVAARIYKASDNTRLALVDLGVSSTTFTLEEETECYLSFYQYQVSYENVNTEIMIEEGIVATEYVSYNSLAVKVTGKNILKYPFYDTTKTINGITFTDNGDGSVTANGTATGQAYFILHRNSISAGNYVLSGCPKGGSTTTYGIYFANQNYSIMKWDLGDSVKINMSNEQQIDIVLNIPSGSTVNNLIFKPQLEKGTEPTDYEPYKSQTAYFPLAEGQKLMEGSYLSDNGVHNVRKQVVLDGSDDEIWGGYTSADAFNYTYYTNILNCKLGYQTSICSHFKNVNGTWSYLVGKVGQYSDHPTYNYKYFNSDKPTLTEWKSWLQQHPITVECELAEEEIIPYTEEQQKAWNKIKQLKTYKNITNITSDAYAKIVYARDNGLDIYETKPDAQNKYIETTEKFAEQKITIDGIKSEVSSTQTTFGNKITELTGKFNDYAPKSEIVTIQNSVTTLQTNTYTKTEINTKLIDGSVEKVSTTSGTFDENGLTIEKTDAKTKGNFNEKGITVLDATSGGSQELLFAGYDEELNETIVRSKNMTVEKYFVESNIARREEYSNPVLRGKGIGVFML